MVGWKRLLVYSAVSFSAICMSNDSSSKYHDSPGGLNERFLNQHFFERFKDEKNLEYLANTDTIEKKHYFEKLHPIEGVNEIMFTLISENDNEMIIYKLSQDEKEPLNKRELKLKGLLDELDEIKKNTPDENKFLRLMHDRINLELKVGNPFAPYVGILPMIDGQAGDCNDISAVHSSFYSHYGFETKIKYGRARTKDKISAELHAWLEVNTPSGIIYLDPTWYREFAPLEPRIENPIAK